MSVALVPSSILTNGVWSIVRHSIEQGFEHFAFFCYQSFVCALFTILGNSTKKRSSILQDSLTKWRGEAYRNCHRRHASGKEPVPSQILQNVKEQPAKCSNRIPPSQSPQSR